jgi:hypothetical protein
MKSPWRELAIGAAFVFGAVAAPAIVVIPEAVNTPRLESHDAAYARALLRETRLARDDRQAEDRQAEDRQATTGGSMPRGLQPGPQSGD